jgi:hypothetical protein
VGEHIYVRDPIVQPLGETAKVLVVGGRVDALPDEILDHPQTVVWDLGTQRGEGSFRGEVPGDVQIILMTRWISHPQRNKLMEIAKSRGIWMHPHPLTTSQLRKYVRVLLGWDPPVNTQAILSTAEEKPVLTTPMASFVHQKAEVPNVPKTMRKRGDITKFIAANLPKTIPPDMTLTMLADQLHKAAEKAGLTGVSQTGFRQSYFKAAKDAGLRSKLAMKRDDLKKAKGQSTTSATPQVVQPVAQANPVPKPSSIHPTVANVLALIDDAISGMQLIRNRVEELEAHDQKTRERLDQLKALLS